MTKPKKMTLADGTEVEVEDVPIDRTKLEAALILPEEEREKHRPTQEEREADAQHADELFKELEAIEEDDGQVKTH